MKYVMLKQPLKAVFLWVLSSSLVYALAIPKPSALDPRIQTVTYHAHQVYHIKASVGRAILVQLEEDESLDEEKGLLGMGDSQAWNLAVKRNNILFKPLVANPDTNLIVNTNKRTYVFQLSVEAKGNQSDTYLLRFVYPDTLAHQQKEAQRRQQQIENVLDGEFVYASKKNLDYWGYGDKELKPTAMYDDGKFTYLEFDHSQELPAIYKVLPDGTEALVNTHIKGHTVVIHELSKTFLLRLGNQVLGIENRRYNAKGRFNHLGTSSDRHVRLLKETGDK